MSPYRITEPTCISFSGGRSSAYMLYRVLEENNGIPDGSIVTFANTGKEDAGTLDFVQDCRIAWNVQIVWLEYGRGVVNFNTASRNGEPFDALTNKKSYLPNPVARFCTQELKIKPIYEYVGDMPMMLGIRADEPRRAAKMPHHLLPLVRDNVTKADVMAFWAKQPFDLHTEAGNCDLCFLKGSNELMGLIRKNPDRAIWWANQEKKIGATFRPHAPSYAAMRENAINQVDMFGYDPAVECFCGD